MCFAKTSDMIIGFPLEFLRTHAPLEKTYWKKTPKSRAMCCHPNVMSYCQLHPEYTPVLCWAVDADPDDQTCIEGILHSVLADKNGNLFEITPGMRGSLVVREPRMTSKQVMEYTVRQRDVFANVSTMSSEDLKESGFGWTHGMGRDFFKMCGC